MSQKERRKDKRRQFIKKRQIGNKTNISSVFTLCVTQISFVFTFFFCASETSISSTPVLLTYHKRRNVCVCVKSCVNRGMASVWEDSTGQGQIQVGVRRKWE